uniref:Uncharacterized protein n=1 Tax=Mesocestoides corti TaxID=53468 RepID=A0A5K3FL84_MESCO
MPVFRVHLQRNYFQEVQFCHMKLKTEHVSSYFKNTFLSDQFCAKSIPADD